MHQFPTPQPPDEAMEAELRRRIAAGETATIELKRKPPRPAELAERICGIANTRMGGAIIFGVTDDPRTIVGVPNPPLAIDLIHRAVRLVHPP
ncbi:MAG TPA: ATP-binding protein [Chloroflexia bacterium]|nr:ATP-binding protein [Chloroflexia bacterium]